MSAANFVQSEEKAKAAKLIAAIVVVFGLGAWRVAGAMEPPAKGAPAASPTETVGASTAAPAPSPVGAPSGDATAGAAPEDDAIRLPATPVASNLNPFREIAAEPDAERTAPRAPATTISGSLASPLPNGPLSNGPLGGVPLAVAPLPTTPPPAPLAARAPLRVTGIVAGPNGTAVLDLGGETRVVRVGVRLPDGTVVLKIDPATVTVRQDGKTKTLDVGE